MCAAFSPRHSGPQWSIGSSVAVGPTPSTSSSTNEQLDAFIKERLDRWELEAAKVICIWGRVGDMCSPDYQSQLRKAQATLQEARRGKERQCEGAVGRVQDDAQTAARHRHRDRLTAVEQSQEEAKVKATQRLQQREDKRRRMKQRSQLFLASAQAVQRPSPLLQTGGARSYRRPTPPSVARASAVQTVRKLELGHEHTLKGDSNARLAMESTVKSSDNNSNDSSSLELDSDSDQSISESCEGNAFQAGPGESLSSTFAVRRLHAAHKYSTKAPRYVTAHYAPVRADGCPPCRAPASTLASTTPSPSKVSQPLLQPQRGRRSLSNATIAGTANSSLSLIDMSLPVEADELTAIFTSRSRSQEKTSPQQRCTWGGDVGPYTSSVTAEPLSPIKDTHSNNDFSLLSSAGSYLRGVDGGN
ncbi:hypothetical protein ABL78_3855 [Leptomonas seymouri]|uniref:Uncharacterized protein n=1 Tax=Leptomonas seymouri TaxID=5684 RepID=A0A0N1I776_LEPSE|nr:hypothetical protein ABL78_3855 [Leptomonas seymouri]|eukprot:KPI87043.1 hypothetical protein ABL78_3855 [Leptomonas seymouri]